MHPLYEKANAASAEVYEAALEVQKHFGVVRVILKGANTPDA